MAHLTVVGPRKARHLQAKLRMRQMSESLDFSLMLVSMGRLGFFLPGIKELGLPLDTRVFGGACR